jgi:AcrR family transcriptional regulator
MSGVVRGKRRPTRPDSLNVVRGQETRRAILAAARGRIIAAGFEALRLDDLAADVGITKPAVIKSVGGKSTILLTLRDEDRQERLNVVRAAGRVRGTLRTRLLHVARAALALEQPRIELVNAYIGYGWFWTGKDHLRVEEGLKEVRDSLAELIAAIEPQMSPVRVQAMTWRMVAGYVVALRAMYNDKITVEAAAALAVGIAVD